MPKSERLRAALMVKSMRRSSTSANPGGGSTNGKVAVVILNWNTALLTTQCADALLRSDYHPLEIIVIDNGSTDGSADTIAARHPEIALVRNSVNVGFAEGSNQGIRLALKKDAAYVMLLNNDAIVDWRRSLALLKPLPPAATGSSLARKCMVATSRADFGSCTGGQASGREPSGIRLTTPRPLSLLTQSFPWNTPRGAVYLSPGTS
jgi:hypothetical protein